MSCFWDGILRSLELHDFYHILANTKPLTARQLVNFLKKHNTLTRGLQCNKIPLRETQLQENFEAISQFDVENIYDGYLCSTLDPFLCLVSYLFDVEIQHDYNRVLVIYSKINSRVRRVIRYRSDSNHFWYG